MSRHLWPTVFILILAAFLRLHELGADSLWMDEAVSVFGARPPAHETLAFVLTGGVHPPLYYFLQKVSFPLGGSEFALRWPAAVIGVPAVSAMARLGREWISRNAGVLVALPALMLAAAAGMLPLLRRRKAIGLALSGLLLAAPLMANLALFDDQTDAREDWQGAAKFIQSEERPGDVLVLRSVICRLPFGHYYQGGAQPQSVDTGWRLTSPSEWREPGQRLWLVYRGRLEDAHRFAESLAADFDRDEAEASVREWLRAIEPYLVERHDFPGVAVSLYDFSTASARPHLPRKQVPW